MGDALLADAGVGGPEVADQRALVSFDEELLQGRRAAARVDQVVAASVVGEAPQPVGLPVHPPAGLITGTMPEGVDGDGARSPATWAAIASANSVTASGPRSGSASACPRDNSPRLAASRITLSSGSWAAAIPMPVVYHARAAGAMPDKRRTSRLLWKH